MDVKGMYVNKEVIYDVSKFVQIMNRYALPALSP